VTVYCANGTFDGRFFRWHAVWDEDQTSGSPDYLGGFHFYHPHELTDAISLVYQLTSHEKPDGTAPAFFSKSFKTKTVERKGQRGKRREVKARLVLHPTDTSFASVDMAVETILDIVEAHSITLRRPIPPRELDGEGVRRQEFDPAERAACAAIERQTKLVMALLAEAKMFDRNEIMSNLDKFDPGQGAKRQVSHNMLGLLRRCVLQNKELWQEEPDLTLLEQERKRWRSYRQQHAGG
jgi:hypothetical protein